MDQIDTVLKGYKPNWHNWNVSDQIEIWCKE